MTSGIRKCLQFLALSTLWFGGAAESELSMDESRPSIEPPGSLKAAPGIQMVRRECTICHSEQLIARNRASREGWAETIRWMQKTQNLRDFSADELKVILDYLAKNYAPANFGRRPALKVRDWYRLGW